MNPVGFHLDLMLIHCMNPLLISLLVYRLVDKSFLRQYSQFPLLVSFLFAVHPRTVESVCMINARTDSLCAMFYLVSLISYLHWKNNSDNRWVWVSWSTFAFALLSKEMAVSLPMVFLLIYESSVYCHNKSDLYTRYSDVFKRISGHIVVGFIVFGIIRSWA